MDVWHGFVMIPHHFLFLGDIQYLDKSSFFSTCRAAFMCGREPNFELSEEEKNELVKYTWDDFLAMTRNTITSKSETCHEVFC